MPWPLLWMLLWPSLVSIGISLTAWAMLRRGARPVAVGRARTSALVGAAVLVMAVHPVLGVAPLWVDVPGELWSMLMDVRYILPLVLALVTLVPLAVARPRPVAVPAALLTPRSWRSFVASWWLTAHLAVLALILALTVAAGLASQPDDDGDHTMYVVDLGSASIGTEIYGWHFSVLPMALLGVLTAATWWALTRIARPPLTADHAAAIADRRLRSVNVLRITLGALLLHLGTVLDSLGSTSRLAGRFSGGRGGPYFSTGTPFSAFSGTLDVLALLAGLVGLALWAFTALTAVPAPSRPRTAEPVS